MLAAPKIQRVAYGMVTNGRNFVFVKLDRGERPTYKRSQEFVIDRNGDLEQTLRIIKKAYKDRLTNDGITCITSTHAVFATLRSSAIFRFLLWLLIFLVSIVLRILAVR